MDILSTNQKWALEHASTEWRRTALDGAISGMKKQNQGTTCNGREKAGRRAISPSHDNRTGEGRAERTAGTGCRSQIRIDASLIKLRSSEIRNTALLVRDGPLADLSKVWQKRRK
jgi:hypothetical protein